MSSTDFQKSIGYRFKDKELLEQALTHRSYLNENPSWAKPHNERLEFLGDAILELAVTEELFNRFPDKPEGEMTSLRAALVNTVSLAEVGRSIEIDSVLKMSRGEKKDIGRAREAILANAVEALIGALYLDGDFKKAKKFILTFIVSRLDEVLRTKSYIDAKSALQEKVQAERKITPHYQVMKAEGPDHDKEFIVGVYFGQDFIAEGTGKSKHEAEVVAAQKALESME
ncbi:MAG: ribonuclease III [Candidatus Harrisonbacteria bacterium]|nr:ribonuclease III [Candidatus Harrisonbacteria bacterium]